VEEKDVYSSGCHLPRARLGAWKRDCSFWDMGQKLRRGTPQEEARPPKGRATFPSFPLGVW